MVSLKMDLLHLITSVSCIRLDLEQLIVNMGKGFDKKFGTSFRVHLQIVTALCLLSHVATTPIKISLHRGFCSASKSPAILAGMTSVVMETSDARLR